MTVINLADYRSARQIEKVNESHFSLSDLKLALQHLKKSTKAAGHEEVSEMIALALLAAQDINSRKCQ